MNVVTLDTMHEPEKRIQKTENDVVMDLLTISLVGVNSFRGRRELISDGGTRSVVSPWGRWT